MFVCVSLVNGVADVAAVVPRGCVYAALGLGNHREWWPHDVGPQLVIAWVKVLFRLCGGSQRVLKGRSNLMQGRKPEMSWV
jgi:hypothetical protein